MVLVVATFTFMLRLAPVLATGGLRGRRNYDEGVHFAAAQEVLAGHVPYIDFTFLHPPGVILFGLPFAAVGEWWGDDVGLALVRVVIAVIAAGNAALIAVLLSERGASAALLGSGLYAVWPILADTEKSFSLVPLMTAGLLIALLLLRDGSGRGGTFAAGVVLAVTCSLKLWPALLIATVLVVLALTKRSYVTHFMLGTALGAAAWALPVLLVGRGEAVDQIVLAQAGRERTTPVLERLLSYGPPVVGPLLPDLLQAALVALTLSALVAAAFAAGAALWSAVTLVAVVEVVVLAPSFYDHYLAYTAPGICLIFGTAVAPLLFRSSVVRGTAAVGCVGLGLIFTVSTIKGGRVGGALEASAFTDKHQCIWSNDPALLITADARSRQAGDCPTFVDGFGTVLLLGADEADRLALEHLRRSDAALLLPDEISSFVTSPVLRAYVLTHFSREADVGPAQAWVRRTKTTALANT
jgi:hypothetical protein